VYVYFRVVSGSEGDQPPCMSRGVLDVRILCKSDIIAYTPVANSQPLPNTVRHRPICLNLRKVAEHRDPSKLSKDRQQRAHSAKLTHSERSYCHAPRLSATAPSLSAALPVRVVRRDRPEPERPMWVPFVGPKRTKASCSWRQRSIGSVPRRHRPDQRVFARLRSCLCFPARPTCYPSRSPSSG
jgi:hypothetical protein